MEHIEVFPRGSRAWALHSEICVGLRATVHFTIGRRNILKTSKVPMANLQFSHRVFIANTEPPRVVQSSSMLRVANRTASQVLWSLSKMLQMSNEAGPYEALSYKATKCMVLGNISKDDHEY